jgi:hypothetical protein
MVLLVQISQPFLLRKYLLPMFVYLLTFIVWIQAKKEEKSIAYVKKNRQSTKKCDKYKA